MTPYTGTLCIISCCEIKYKFLSDLELQIALEETNHCRLGLWQWSDSDSNSSLVTCYGLLSSPPWNVQTLTPPLVTSPLQNLTCLQLVHYKDCNLAPVKTAKF